MLYLDTSALVKLVVAEPESAALRTVLVTEEDLVTSDLSRTELMMVTRRAAPEHTLVARDVLDHLVIVTLPTAILEAAGRLEPGLRSLDAIHLACALDLGDELTALVTYDSRLADAARHYGLAVLAPS